MQTERAVRQEIFRNKRAIFRAIPLFPFQPVGTQIPVLFAQSYFSGRLAPGIFPAISTVSRWASFTGSRSSAFYFFSSHLEKWHLHVRDARTLGGFSRKISCLKPAKTLNKRKNFVMTDQPKKKFPKHCQRVYQTQSPRTWWRANSASRIDCKRGSIYSCKDFPFDPECLWNFQPENLPKWKAPLITPLIIATRGLLRRSPHACTCMRRSQWG